jgi:hypothetical protein
MTDVSLKCSVSSLQVPVGPASPPVVVGIDPLTGWKPTPPQPVAARAIVIDRDRGGSGSYRPSVTTDDA